MSTADWGTSALIGATAFVMIGCTGSPVAPSPPDTAAAPRGGGYYQNDGPPTRSDIDLAAVPDAVPRNEPLSEYGNPSNYEALGRTYYVLESAAGFAQTGRASWYGRQFHGRRTSSGEPYNMFRMTAAHKRLPIPSYVRVTNLDNERQVIVRVNDRGPFHDGRIIDLSYVAARRLGIVVHGSAPVRIETVTPQSLRAEKAPGRSVSPGNDPASVIASTAGNIGNTAAQRTPTDISTPTTQKGKQRPDSASDQAGAAAAKPVRVAQHKPAVADNTNLYLQSGAFGQADNARALRSRLQSAGFERVGIVKPDRETGLYRVRVGPFADDRSRKLTGRILVEQGFAARAVDR